MNPRELVACAESAMMAAKARGKNQSVLFDDTATDRPESVNGREDVRSIAHLKMLQSLAGRLNRLNDVREIGSVIVNELRGLIDYHNCRVYIADGDTLFPIAFKGTLGQYTEESAEDLTCKFGEGFTGWVAETGRPLLLANAMDCEFAVTIPGTDDIDESVVAVPLRYGSRVSRRRRHLEARRRPVRRGRCPLARGARRTRLRRARERPPLRGRAQGSGPRQGISLDRQRAPRLQPRARRRRGDGRRSRPHRRADRAHARLTAGLSLARRDRRRRSHPARLLGLQRRRPRMRRGA